MAKNVLDDLEKFDMTSPEQDELDFLAQGKPTGQEEIESELKDLEQSFPEVESTAVVSEQPDQVLASEVEEKISQPKSKLSKYQELLDAYNKRNRTLAMLQGANQIAQGLARGYGAEIGDGSASIKMLQGMNQDPISQLKGVDEAEMMDANSDISKMYREQAYAVLKKLRPESNFDGKLEGMSASQLLKLPGLKAAFGQFGTTTPWSQTDRVLKDGTPVVMNRVDGLLYNALTRQPIGSGETVFRDVARRDSLTNQYGYVTPQGMIIVGADRSNAVAKPELSKDGNKTPEYTYSQISEKSPEEIKKFDVLRKDFLRDQKENRDLAHSMTILSEKLSFGKKADEADSGILGSIQTQSARMAGQRGVLTDRDMEKFGGAGGWIASAERAVANALQGKMTKRDIEFFKTFKSKMAKSLAFDIDNRTQYFVNQGRQLLERAAPGITEQNVSKLLGAETIAPLVQGDKKDPKIEEYAKQYNLDYDRAKAVLTTRGYKPNEK